MSPNSVSVLSTTFAQDGMRRDDSFLNELVNAFGTTREPHQAAQALGISMNPDLVDARARKRKGGQLMGITNRIIYRADGLTMFTSKADERKDHLRAKARQALEESRRLQHHQREQPTAAVAEENILLQAVLTHFREAETVSLPASPCACTLASALFMIVCSSILMSRLVVHFVLAIRSPPLSFRVCDRWPSPVRCFRCS